MQRPLEPPVKLSPVRPVRPEFVRPGISYRVRRFMTVSLLLVLVGSGMHFIFNHSGSSGPAEIPIIKAEGPTKERPAQPGGIDIPHRDVEVYHELDTKTSSTPPVEHLLPPPEAPQVSPPPQPLPATSALHSAVTTPVAPVPSVPIMESLLSQPPKIETTVTPVPDAPKPETKASRPLVVDVTPPSVTPIQAPAPIKPAAVVSPPPHIDALAGQNSTGTKVADTKVLSQVPPGVTVAPVVAAAPPAKTAPPKISVASVNTAKPLPTKPEAKATVKQEPTKAPPKTAGAKKESVVQLASVPDEVEAQHMMQGLQGKFVAILGETRLRLVRADLGSRGIYYRIQSEPITKELANNICNGVKKLKAGCIIVRH